MTFAEWETVSRRLFGAYPNAHAGAETVLVYFELLEPFDADIVLYGVRRKIRETRFLPTVHELLEVIEPEQEVRQEYAALPDWTGFAQLPEPEQTRRLQQGLRLAIDLIDDERPALPAPEVSV